MQCFIVQVKMNQNILFNKRKLDEIQLALMCRICYNSFCGRKIFQCPNAHPLCSVCEDQLKHPKMYPHCREPFDHPPRRNRQLECLVETVYKDECEDMGCTYKKAVSAQSCDSGLIKCRLCCDEGCDEDGKIAHNRNSDSKTTLNTHARFRLGIIIVILKDWRVVAPSWFGETVSETYHACAYVFRLLFVCLFFRTTINAHLGRCLLGYGLHRDTF